jgi:Alpha-L-arabinofuranosidase B, catalytic/Ricin-type beta-trefoil lectin domain-like
MIRSRVRSFRRLLLAAGAAAALTISVLSGAVGTSQAATSLPCDIYAAAGTPCVAAHSTVRALYAAYDGPLYQVRRASDKTTLNISPLTTGGYANAAAQNSFCAGTSCTITEIYDQSPEHNNLTIEGAGGNGSADVGANASALPVVAGGHQVYGLYVTAGVGYRDNATKGVATGSTGQGEYMVASGSHVNGGCCFDYGNAETNSDDNGNGHMDAINFSTECWFSPCSGSGPWVQADLENGLFAGANGSDTSNKGNSSAFVTALVKNNGTTTYAIKGGNAQSGGLTTWYSGALPDLGGYAPMHQEGAIVLGTGGDNSKSSIGTFFEGVMTSGYPTDAADSAVQANIVSVGYGAATSFPVAGTAYRLTNSNSGTVLDDVDCETANGTRIDLWASLGNTCQQWKFASAGSGYYTITSVNSGTVLDSVDCGTANGTLVDLWAALGNTCQEWSVVPISSAHYVIVNRGNSLVLDATDCETANGTVVDQWTGLGNTCQEWNIAP